MKFVVLVSFASIVVFGSLPSIAATKNEQSLRRQLIAGNDLEFIPHKNPCTSTTPLRDVRRKAP